MCHSLQPACERRKLDRDSCAPARVHLNWLRVHPKRCDLVRTSRAFVAQAAGSFVRRRIVAPAGLPPPDFPRLRSKPSWPSPARAAAHPNFLRARRFRRVWGSIRRPAADHPQCLAASSAALERRGLSPAAESSSLERFGPTPPAPARHLTGSSARHGVCPGPAGDGAPPPKKGSATEDSGGPPRSSAAAHAGTVGSRPDGKLFQQP
jgi:hypothetical protein